MLSYKKITFQSFKYFKDSRTFLTALIMAAPVLIYTIVSFIILDGLINDINVIINGIYEYLEDANNVVTSAYINQRLANIIDVVIKNIDLILIDVAINIAVNLILILLTYVFYYMSYKIVKKEKTDIKTLFSHLWGGICLAVLYEVKIFLWSLLLIIPGIVKSFSYSLCFFIKAENPDMKASMCIKKSKELMKGRRERLFIQYLLFLLVYVIASFVISNVSMIIGFIPEIGNYFTNLLYAYLGILSTVYWTINVCIYYNEVKEDEKYINEHPELKERGITGVMKDERKKIKIQYGPYFKVEDPYKTEEKTFKDPYDNNPFKQNNNKNNGKEDPFED